MSAVSSFDCSVVIPLFNKQRYIARALASVLGQTSRPREILVVDDGSTDDGPRIVEAFAAQHPFLHLLRQANGGPAAARNRGCAEARGAWVSFLDADDAYLPWFLTEMSLLANLAPAADMLAAGFCERKADFSLDEPATNSIQDETVWRGELHNFYDRWWRGNFFFTSSIAVRRSAARALGEPFPVGENYGEDLELFFRMVEQGTVAWTSRVSSVYAIDVADSLMAIRPRLALVPAYQRLRSRVDRPGFPAGERAGARRCLATYWLSLARQRAASGDGAGATELLCDPIASYRPLYRIRTAGVLAAMAAQHRLTRSQLAGNGMGKP